MPPNRAYRHASPGLFAAQGSRLLAGRDFTWDDVFDRRRLAIVSENMARESWGEPRQALGKRIRIGRNSPWTEVVGVVENIHADGLHQPAPATVYARAGVGTAANGSTTVRRAVTLTIRSSNAGSQAFLKEVAAAVHAVNASVPLADVRMLEHAYWRSMAQTSFTGTLLGIARRWPWRSPSLASTVCLPTRCDFAFAQAYHFCVGPVEGMTLTSDAIVREKDGTHEPIRLMKTSSEDDMPDLVACRLPCGQCAVRTKRRPQTTPAQNP
jgi:MacB-like periplasmic core domain